MKKLLIISSILASTFLISHQANADYYENGVVFNGVVFNGVQPTTSTDLVNLSKLAIVK